MRVLVVFYSLTGTTRRVAQAVLGERSDLPVEEFGPGRFLSAGRAAPVERLQPG